MSDFDGWLQIAAEALGRAKAALDAGQYSHAGFYAQRSVGNAAKGLIVATGEPPPGDTELAELLDWVPAGYQASLNDELWVLDDYYAATPDDLPANRAGEADARQAIAWAAETIDTIKELAANI